MTDVLVRRGDREVVHAVAENRARAPVRRRLLNAGRAGRERRRAGREGRACVPTFRRGCSAISCSRRPKWCSSGCSRRPRPRRRRRSGACWRRSPARSARKAPPRDYSAAQRTIEALRQAGKLDEAALVEFAKTGPIRGDGRGAGIALPVPIEVVDRLMRGDRPDPVLILVQVGRLGLADREGDHPGAAGKASDIELERLDAACSQFRAAVVGTAQRVMRFWQIRRPMTDDRGRSRQAMPGVHLSSSVISSPSSGR